MRQEEDSVQVVDFVLHRSRHQVFAFHLDDFSLCISGADSYSLVAADIFPEAWDAETAFFTGLFALFMDDLRVDQNYFVRFDIRLAAGGVDYRQPFVNVDLRGGQSETSRGVHR